MNPLESKTVKLIGTFAAILVLLIFNAWFLNFNFQKVSEQERLVSHTAEVMGDLDETISLAKDMETGARGYLVTNEASFLDPFREGKIAVPLRINQVRKLTRDNPEQQTNCESLDAFFSRVLEINQRMIDARPTRSFSPTQELAMMTEGKSLMDSLRAQVQKMKEAEQRRLVILSREASNAKYFFFWSLVLTTLLSVGFIGFTFHLFRKNQMQVEKEANEKASLSRIQESVAEASRVIAGDISVEKAASEVQQFLARKIQILGSRIFVSDSGQLRAVSSYGTDVTAISPGQRSLVDEAYARQGLWQIENIPPDYWKIGSSLGSALPTVLVFVPFAFQGRPLGVIELALFTELDLEQEEILLKIADIVGVGFNAAQSRLHLQRLLEETQQQSEELQAQQEELKTNNEELEQQARALETQQQAMNAKNRELEISQANLEEKAADLQLSSHYKSEFLAKMSHELRTPLNGLLILSTLLMENKQKNLSEQQLRFAQSINSAGNDLLTLINDILDLSKIEARKLSLRPEEFALKVLFEQKAQVFEHQAHAKNIEFKTVLEPSLGDTLLFTDRQRLEQILRNFLSNAIKFTETGFVSLEAKSLDAGDRIEISVRDSGIGIPKQKQNLVFEAFEQVDSSISRKFGGTGLGLTISRELAHLLGGEISLQSEEGRGSVFTLRIPRQLPADALSVPEPVKLKSDSSSLRAAGLPREVTGKATQQASREAETALRGLPQGIKTLLIVEDDEHFLQGVIEAAKTYNFHPIAARDGEVALAILEKHTPDAILLDIKLPGISGLGILEMIKHLPHLRHVPVHMISALDYQRSALRMGALGYLTKPVTMEKVKSALERIENLISDHVRRILLIEDDERQSLAISELVAGKDVEVVPSHSGKDAIDKLNNASFDCIILDLTLPDISGFDLLSELNSLAISLPPIVIYTGREISREEEEYLRKFSESIIIKGARSPERLLDEVNLFLHRVESLLPESKQAMLSSMRSQEKSFENKTVLVVDDDLRNVFALTSALESKDLSVRIAKDGVEALEMLEKHADIDLVLMDIMMPRMDGFEAMRRIRRNPDPRVRNLPVIALTAKAMREDHEKCIEAGASDYLPKPVNLENLLTALKVWLSPQEFFS